MHLKDDEIADETRSIIENHADQPFEDLLTALRARSAPLDREWLETLLAEAQAAPDAELLGKAVPAGITTRKHGRKGFDVVLDEERTQAVVKALVDLSSLKAGITAALKGMGWAGPEVVAGVAIMAVALRAKAIQIDFVDRGNGVYFPMPVWLWAPLAAQAVSAPVMALEYAMLVVTPKRNR
ncbi:MAG: hypothetical protein AAGF30_11420 [Pseudomonadota bacterium]